MSTVKKPANSLSASVIVSTYNSPDYLRLTLATLCAQDRTDFEIIVADDGSGPETGQLIKEFASSTTIPIQHVWQEDHGFRLARIRNLAVKKSDSDYLIFTDGDCLLRQDFVTRHLKIRGKRKILLGNRVNINQSFTNSLLGGLESPLGITSSGIRSLRKLAKSNQIDNWVSLIQVPGTFWRSLKKKRWIRSLGCNLSLRKEDYIAVNGHNETFEGWGHEETDMVVRLVNYGCRLRSSNFATEVLHLWHPVACKEKENSNWKILANSLSSQGYFTEQGYSNSVKEG